MTNQKIVALSTAISSALLVLIFSLIGISELIWVGFAGCTSFFISENKLRVSLLSNLLGITICTAIIAIVNLHPTILVNSVITGILAGVMMLFAKSKYINGSSAFLAGLITFAFSSTLLNLSMISAILFGNLFGLLTHYFIILFSRGKK